MSWVPWRKEEQKGSGDEGHWGGVLEGLYGLRLEWGSNLISVDRLQWVRDMLVGGLGSNFGLGLGMTK